MSKQPKPDLGQTLQNCFAFNVTKVCFPNKNIFLERSRFTVWTLSFPLLQNNRGEKEPFQFFTPLINKTFFGVWQEKYVMNVLDMLWLIAV